MKRTPITMITQSGRSYGGWMHFEKGTSKPPQHLFDVTKKLNKKSSGGFRARVLWCPYCGEWTVYRIDPTDRTVWKCTGWCGWANSNDYYVSKQNHLFGNTKGLMLKGGKK